MELKSLFSLLWRGMSNSSVCQHFYMYFSEAQHEECIRSKPNDKAGKIAKSSSFSAPAGSSPRHTLRIAKHSARLPRIAVEADGIKANSCIQLARLQLKSLRSAHLKMEKDRVEPSPWTPPPLPLRQSVTPPLLHSPPPRHPSDPRPCPPGHARALPGRHHPQSIPLPACQWCYPRRHIRGAAVRHQHHQPSRAHLVLLPLAFYGHRFSSPCTLNTNH
jgi:hypothetical protein